MSDRSTRWACLGVFVSTVLCTAFPAGAQQRAAGPTSGAPEAAGVAGRSMLLPGWGQHHLGQRRWIGYALVEVALWALWADRRGAGAEFRTEYRDLAWNVGRLQGATRVDGDWTYYERLSNWTRSGHFDGDAQQSGVQPEEDGSTYNGSIWDLAQRLFSTSGKAPNPDDPAYGRALAYYTDRAYGPEFLWDWTGKDAALADFNLLIERSDDRFRQATAAMGAVFANHLLSATDGFLSARVSRPAGIRVTTDPYGRGARWTMTLHLGGLR